MLSWEYYRKRKNLNVKRFLDNNGLKTYDQFCKYLRSIGVTPPSKVDAPAFRSPRPKKSKLPTDKPSVSQVSKTVKTAAPSKPKARKYSKKSPESPSQSSLTSKTVTVVDREDDLDDTAPSGS